MAPLIVNFNEYTCEGRTALYSRHAFVPLSAAVVSLPTPEAYAPPCGRRLHRMVNEEVRSDDRCQGNCEPVKATLFKQA